MKRNRNYSTKNFVYCSLFIIIGEIVSVFATINVKLNPVHLNVTASLENFVPESIGNALLPPVQVSAGFGIKNREKKTLCGRLATPTNSEAVCNLEKCQITCKSGYQTSSGQTIAEYVCKDSQWFNAKSGNSIVEKCEPVCQPECQNGGKCVVPNLCQCGMNFYGPACEYEKVPCKTAPATPLYSFKKCQADNCTFKCMPGKEFPDRSTSVQLFCDTGKWVSSKSEWITIPNCQAICDPPCLNGGKCIDTGTCFCLADYRGKQCQHPISNCDTSKLNFNGNYHCTGDEEQFSCQLSCPGNAKSTEPFEPHYNCTYSQGEFKPANVPQCQIGAVIQSTKVSRHKSRWYSTSSMSTSCVLWNARYLKALNHQIFNFKKANCIYTLIEDDLQHLFHIQVDMNGNGIRKLIIYINNMKYELSKNVDGKPILMSEGNENPLTIPCQLTDLKVEIGSGKSVAVFLPATNLYLVWSEQGQIQVDVSAEFFNRTTGLCGRGSTSLLPPADLQVHFKKAAVVSLTDQCSHVVEDPGFCEGDRLQEAIETCKRVIKSGPVSEKCATIVPTTITEEYMVSCIWAHCNSEHEDRSKSVCYAASKYVQTCSQLSPETKVDWRSQANCLIECPANRVHTNCKPVSQATCAANEVLPTGLQRYCQEGCVCESGYVLHGDKCIKKEDCPCTYGGEFYDTKSVIPKDCNKCICEGGKWSCTEATCKAECLLYSGLHYRTFDGKKFDFAGSCSYSLLASESVHVVQEHTTITLPNSRTPRRLKTFVIRVGKQTLALRESNQILINDHEIEALPTTLEGGVHIRRASTLLTEVTLPDGSHIFWNGEDNFQIFANSSVSGKTKGLCGTFNSNQQDDFRTPEDDVEHDVHVFASSWKTDEHCASEKIDLSSACEIFVQNKPVAESFCKNLTAGALFKTCNAIVNPNEYFENCMTDVCACEQNDLAKCFCPSVSAYAQECARQGVVIDWRKEIRTCGVQCNVGQKFEPCGLSCQRSCSDISDQVSCHGSCTEGCYCPPGYTLDEHELCIPISECPCVRNGRKYVAGYVDMRNGTSTTSLTVTIEACTCQNAAWKCRDATAAEMISYGRQKKCSSSNMEHVDCEPPEPITCRNMHNPPRFSSKTCTPGCVCREGFVLDSLTKKCVSPSECPCHHGGQVYSDGEIIHQDCNNCTCFHGKWKCTTKECPATCTAWGDSHFRSFDGKFFDFQGTCDYLFAKGSLANDKTFSINIQIVPCGSGGISCTKSLTVNVGSETVILDKDVDVYSKKTFKNFNIISVGLYVVVTIRGLSVTLQWDKGTRVSLHVHPKWRNKLSGLCGNYNGNSLDDFQTPSGGLVEVSPLVFADSWKLQQHCPLPYEIQDTCLIHPNRKFWSVMKCSQLKDNPIFKRCHSQVPVDEFYKRCVFDSCACDQGGDCECLCTAFAAYAQECNAKGVSLKWRGQDICPIQCEPYLTYSSCISACPAPTCSNLGMLDSMTQECRDLPCVEGCQPTVTCPAEKILQNNTCIVPADCDCMNHNGQMFKENEKFYEDECHSCYCSKGKKVCVGTPCGEVIVHMSVERKVIVETVCIEGWSNWISIPRGNEILLGRRKAIKLGNYTCPAFGMLDVRCRKKSQKLLGLLASDWQDDEDCEFGRKIKCDKKNCHEIQIQINCNCSAGIITDDGENEFMIATAVCRVKCDQLCHHYKHQLHAQGRCKGAEKCVEGLSNVTCPDGSYWRDAKTCVPQDACTCASRDGSLIKPSTVFHESDCSICQCVNNEYVCTLASCATEAPPIDSSVMPTSTEFIVPDVTLTPLPICSSDRLILIDHEAKYNATSGSRQNSPNTGENGSENDTRQTSAIWRAEIVDADQYLDVDLGRIQPVYGVEVSGDAENVEYVQAYQVLYSSDGVSYSYAKPAFSEDEKFRGPYDQNAVERQLFQTPVEARYLRIRPTLWQNWISMRVRVLGCELTESTTPPGCNEPMGLENGRMSPCQVSVSSTLFHNFTAADASLGSSTGWAPFIASSDQFIQFDFLEDRQIEGLKLKGTNSLLNGRAWVEAYKVRYSSDAVNWHQILNADEGEKVFSGNYDHSHIHSNVFELPLRTRYLRLYPVKWRNFPALRIEVIGCFEPYPLVTTPEPVEKSEDCNLCLGIISPNCSCVGDVFWDGHDCVKKEYCPCVEGLLTYAVGSVYTKTGCQKCVCSLGGMSTCHAAEDQCSDCALEGELKQVYDDCTCECKPCPEDTRLCPTSNVCLNESLWCNGYKECADDEVDCLRSPDNATEPTVVPEITTTKPPIVIPPSTLCPPSTCPEGYTAVFSQLQSKAKERAVIQYGRKEETMRTLSFNQTVQIYSHSEETDFESSSVSIVKTRGKLSQNCTEYVGMQRRQSEKLEHVECRDWTCVASSATCDKPVCPPGTKLTVKWTGAACPAYECLVPPPTEKECSVSGRLISTFDGTSFKYDMCNHILARDKVYNTWSVKRMTKCPFVGPCVFSLVIKHDNDLIELFSNFTNTYNGYKYTIAQLQAIGSRGKSFSVQPVSTKHVIFASFDLKFNVIWGSDGYTKIIVDSSLHNMIDGLCGFFDFVAANDKRKPDGVLASTTQEFGDSWKMDNDICESKVCPKDVQAKATEICDAFKQDPFKMCDLTVDIAESVAKCYEYVCTCATTTNDFDKDCRCNVLHQFATRCLSSQPGVDLSAWRLKYECPVTCPAPFVYRDCYDRVCEPDCDSLLQEDRCPRVPDRCFPGCYCPEGLIRKGDTCIKSSECRDCVCNSNGLSQFTTFDQVQVPFDGSCSSYTMLQTKATEWSDSDLQVIVTNSPCTNPVFKGVCPHSLTVIFDSKVVLLSQSHENLNQVKVRIDSAEVDKFPYSDDGMSITHDVGKSVKLSVPSLQLDVTFMAHNKGFQVQLPSSMYQNKLEGLCGSCNREPTDDIRTPTGQVAEKLTEFLTSWKTNYTADTEKQSCVNYKQEIKAQESFTVECVAPQRNDPCTTLLKPNIFGQCHAIVDPYDFVDQCHNLICQGDNHCLALEAYVEECQEYGICVEWRDANTCPHNCPEGFVYEACSLGCEVNCDNYKQLRETPDWCAQPRGEKCVCPAGQVLSEGVCINELRCQPCDENDHYLGDKWVVDNCTQCECAKDGSLSCQTKQCPGAIVCPLNMTAQVDRNNDDACCEKYVCVMKEPKSTCPEPVLIECGKDQVVKFDVNADGCTYYVCVCRAREECPPLEGDRTALLPPGMVRREKTEGCCPTVEQVCDPSTCPVPSPCPPHHSAAEEKSADACCPEIKCTLPPSTCMHEYRWIADFNVSERARLPSERLTELKRVGETWSDGPCHTCICTADSPKGICNAVICPVPVERENYVTKSVNIYGECCPTYKVVACRWGGQTYQVNSTWPNPEDPCKTMVCEENSRTGEISMKEIITSCSTECELGWSYKESENESECCGACKQDSCVEGGVLHPINSKWSSDDGCVKFECDETFNIRGFSETCPNIADCPIEQIYEEGCCKKCKRDEVQEKNLVNCAPVSVRLEDTIKQITKRDPTHGECTNMEQFEGFSRCDGFCTRLPFFDAAFHYDSSCNCCLASKFEPKEVQLTCADGYRLNQTIYVPSKCECQSKCTNPKWGPSAATGPEQAL